MMGFVCGNGKLVRCETFWSGDCKCLRATDTDPDHTYLVIRNDLRFLQLWKKRRNSSTSLGQCFLNWRRETQGQLSECWGHKATEEMSRKHTFFIVIHLEHYL